jgi:hypothetical protein
MLHPDFVMRPRLSCPSIGSIRSGQFDVAFNPEVPGGPVKPPPPFQGWLALGNPHRWHTEAGVPSGPRHGTGNRTSEEVEPLIQHHSKGPYFLARTFCLFYSQHPTTNPSHSNNFTPNMSAQIPIAVRTFQAKCYPNSGPSSTNKHLQIRDRVSERAKKTLDIVAKFVEEDCIP